MDRLDWSEQSPHIRSLFRLWHPGDGYEEDMIAAAEARCLAGGQHLATTLRSFYGTWGRRRDLTQMNEYLLSPEEWVVHSGALIFCVENQATAYWALPLESLAVLDPAVVVAYAGPERSVWEVTAELHWRHSHRRVSAFLDALTFMHAFSGGALHGAKSARVPALPEQIAWLEQDWRTAAVASLAYTDPEVAIPLGSPLYVREGQAVEWFDRFFAVANSAQALDEIARSLEIDWVTRW